MTKYYLNEDHTYRPCDLLEWATQFESMHDNDTKHVAKDIIGNKCISTVWLGVDHNFSIFDDNKKPLVFETMIFENDGSYMDIYMDRYTTWDEAIAGHAKAVEWVNDGCKEEDDVLL